MLNKYYILREREDWKKGQVVELEAEEGKSYVSSGFLLPLGFALMRGLKIEEEKPLKIKKVSPKIGWGKRSTKKK